MNEVKLIQLDKNEIDTYHKNGGRYTYGRYNRNQRNRRLFLSYYRGIEREEKEENENHN